jgi:hypothetical protein
VCILVHRVRLIWHLLQGKIEFGVVSQSQSAFSHILSDVSLVVYQFESLAGFSAVVDRLGQFQEAIEAKGKLRQADDAQYALDPSEKITSIDLEPSDGELSHEAPSAYLCRCMGCTVCDHLCCHTRMCGTICDHLGYLAHSLGYNACQTSTKGQCTAGGSTSQMIKQGGDSTVP